MSVTALEHSLICFIATELKNEVWETPKELGALLYQLFALVPGTEHQQVVDFITNHVEFIYLHANREWPHLINRYGSTLNIRRSKQPITEFKDEYRFLSNFWPAELYMNVSGQEMLFETVEHYYQAMKATNWDDFHKVQTAPSPGAAKRGGRRIAVRGDWDIIKRDVMYNAVLSKFKNNADLKQNLLDTGKRLLIEGNHWKDDYWGFRLDEGYGQNHLGRILMQIRTLMQQM